MDPNPFTTEPAGNLRPSAMAWSGREAGFRKRYASILKRRDKWLSLGIMALLGAAAAAFLLSDPAPAPVQASHSSSPDFEGYLVIVLLAALVVQYILSRAYERLYIGDTGIRYTSFLGGPFAFLASFYPDWELRWDELADIRLVKRRQGRGIAWYYVFASKATKDRQVTIAWAPVGAPPDDFGLTLWQLLTSDVAAWKAGIAGTELFHLLDLAMRARKGQFQHPLIQDQ